jgi:hypothetical protein
MGVQAHRATQSAKPAEVEHRWFVVDATDQVLGRLASRVAARLRGKHRAIFTPHVDTGDYVIVVNAEKVRLTGRKREQKIYYRHTGYTGHLNCSRGPTPTAWCAGPCAACSRRTRWAGRCSASSRSTPARIIPTRRRSRRS